jgi:hypothetical protein
MYHLPVGFATKYPILFGVLIDKVEVEVTSKLEEDTWLFGFEVKVELPTFIADFFR